MKVKINEETIKHEIDGVLNVFLKDEERAVPDEVGAYFCKQGWAEDVSGSVETGVRDADSNVGLAVDNTASAVEVDNG